MFYLPYQLVASVLGVIWVTSRFSYAWGYYTGGKSLQCTYRSLLQFSEVITNAKAHLDLFLNPSTNVKSIAFICALNYRFK